MRFCDMLLKDPTIEEWVKQGLDGVPVIECDNVSRYFFEESDQEFWDMKGNKDRGVTTKDYRITGLDSLK